MLVYAMGLLKMLSLARLLKNAFDRWKMLDCGGGTTLGNNAMLER
jgi:hypothetical protein